MPHTYEEVRQIANELPTEERILLANSLWESVEPCEELAESEIEAAWGEEIKRRLDEIDSGAVKLIPHEEFMADLDAHIASKR